MDASFRRQHAARESLLILLLLPFFLAWSAVGFYISLKIPTVTHPIALSVMLGGFPLFMSFVGVTEIFSIRRHALTIQGNRLEFRSLLRTREIDLKEVTDARWRPYGEGREAILLRTSSSKLVVPLGYYERTDQQAIVRHLHSVIDTAVQRDWNLFAYKMTLHAPKPPRTKAGPDEILVNRADWDRRLLPFGLPFVVVSGVIGVVAWRMTGDAKHLGVVIAGIVAPLVGWLVLRYQVPAEGRVDPKLSAIWRTNSHSRFMLNGIVLLFVGMMLIGLLWRFLRYPEVLLVSFMLLWTSFLVWECEKESRRKARQDRELADLAAKDRGEPRADTWGAE
jgi:hypothetical protein